MVERYYLPGLSYYLSRMNPDIKGQIARIDGDFIEFRSPEERYAFLDRIRQIDFVHDRELYHKFKKHFPEILPYMDSTPISKYALRDAAVFIFEELPAGVFDHDSTFATMTAVYNQVIRKNEISFIAVNTANGRLRCDQNYRYKRFEEFYFQMMKLVYNLDTYYEFFSRFQVVLGRLFIKEILFSEKKIDRKQQESLNRIFNFVGGNLADYKYKLISVKNQIRSNRLTVKRTGIPLPGSYDEVEATALSKINTTIEEIDKHISEIVKAKKQLRSEVSRRHGLISKETAKRILREIKWFRPFIKE